MEKLGGFAKRTIYFASRQVD